MPLDPGLAAAAIKRHVGDVLGLSVREAASAIFALACERMVIGIEEITLNQGIDARGAILIGGGGGAGLYSVPIARRLKIRRVVIPETSAGLSAAGALLSPLRSDTSAFLATDTDGFDFAAVNSMLAGLKARAQSFIQESGFDLGDATISFSVEARYPNQNWEIAVPLRVDEFSGVADVEVLRRDFHATHERMFAHRDEGSKVELVAWHASAICPLPELSETVLDGKAMALEHTQIRPATFGNDTCETPIYRRDSLPIDHRMPGPTIVETPTTTVVVPPGVSIVRTSSNSLILDIDGVS